MRGKFALDGVEALVGPAGGDGPVADEQRGDGRGVELRVGGVLDADGPTGGRVGRRRAPGAQVAAV